jgi:hypothetical protein
MQPRLPTTAAPGLPAHAAGFARGSDSTAGAAFVGAPKKGQSGDLDKSRLVFTISKAL